MPKKYSYTYDIISIGEAGLDSFLNLAEEDASVMCSIDKKNCWLCLSYAEKIPVKDFHETLGHNACNNAVGSSRLGLKTALYCIVGGDDTGDKILKRLKDEKVSCEYVQIQKKSKSTYSVVLNYKTERTILLCHSPHTYNLPALARAQWIYVTSMRKGFEKVHGKIVQYMKDGGVKLAFNPGPQQLLAGRKILEPILKVCSLLILNKEEAENVLGDHSKMKTMHELLHGLYELGPSTVVITDSSRGAYGFDGHEIYFSKPLPSKVLEVTGAGDSFSTGLLAAFSYGKSLSEALLWGAANAASVIEHIGPQAGLLKKDALLKRIKKSRGVVRLLT